MKTITDWLEQWSVEQPTKRLYTFLDIAGRERESYTYRSFLERSGDLAVYLSEKAGLRNGDRVLLAYPPGLETIAAFFACARIGVIAVPVYAPSPISLAAGLAKLKLIARDCGAKAALTTSGFLRSHRLTRQRLATMFNDTPMDSDRGWLTTDDVQGFGLSPARQDPNPILFLQYTSGSTSDPKGVIVSHRNVIANGQSAIQHCPIAVSWLPQYHDMGLIGYYMYPVILGGECYGFSPLDFLRRPALWMETISRVRATSTSAPNFAYDYCLREDKVSDEALRNIDLSSLQLMMNAAEPVRPDTFRRFRERFRQYGLRSEAYMVAYGLAENTLAVSLHGRQTLTVNKLLLQQRSLHVELAQPRNNNQIQLVSCGKPLEGIEIRIVDPDLRTDLGENRIGEIWLDGESKCSGYWNRPDLSRETFEATIANDHTGHSYLRTGDLGFLHEGELFVCGRVKDLIIVRGVNYYPQDIEAIVERASHEIRKGSATAFSIDLDGEARVVVVAEVRNERRLPDAAAIALAIRTQYFIEPHTVAFVRRRSIAKTTSGKISRSKVRETWLSGELPVIESHVSRGGEAGSDLTGLRDRFRYVAELYNLTGREEFTIAELGMDSLTMVTLIGDIKDLLVEHGAGELADEVDVRLLQKLTITQLFGLLDEAERDPQKPLEALRELLRILREEHEAHESACMRADSQLAFPTVVDDRMPTPVSNVLITGASGFFGAFLLASLLKRTPHTFYALVRATDPAHGKDRLRAALRHAQIWTPALDTDIDSRVHVLCGDLAADRLGLSLRQWEFLAEHVQAICHNGALVNYVLNYDVLRPHNVEGTRELLRLAFTGSKKAFHFISSTFIFGWSAQGVLSETDFNAEMTQLDFGYAQTKWVAEQLVLGAGRKGLDVRIYRPALISPSSGGVGSRDDIGIRMLAFMIRYGIAVTARNQISFLPADIVADNVAAIFDLPRTDGSTFHITTDEYYNLMDVTRAMTHLYGYEFTYHDIPDFLKKMNDYCTKDDLLYPLLDFFNRSYAKIEAMQDKRYSNTRYRQARKEAGNVVGDPPLDTTVTFIVEYMLREGIVDEVRRQPSG
jgi:thioester reductase-like protein